MSITLWFFILVLQAMGFTLVSRARNSGSIVYHSAVSIGSNTVWFVSQLFMVSFMTKPEMPLSTLSLLCFVYVAGNTIGSTLMHYVAMKWFETGKRKVGA